MVVRKRKKVNRQRGSKTHGWGAMKKHRGAGNRGGRGRAGSGKRGDAKKPVYWKEKQSKGFVSVKSLKGKPRCINLSDIANMFPGEKDINLTEKKIYKLLGAGNIKSAVNVSVRQASKLAIQKIEGAGGKVILPGAE